MLEAIKPRSAFKSVVSAPVSFLLALFMSRHTKRLFYFASLYASLVPLEELKCDVMTKLNQAMDLARADNALMVPAAFSRVVWGGYNVAKIIEPIASGADEAVVMQRAQALVSIIPHWMRFGTQEEMKKETVKFLRCTDELPTVA